MALHGNKKQVTVLLSPELAERLKQHAEQQQRSISQTAAILIQEGLEKIEDKKENETKT